MGNVKDDSSQQITEGQQKGFDLWPLSQTKWYQRVLPFQAWYRMNPNYVVIVK
jgi:hypothetical protein